MFLREIKLSRSSLALDVDLLSCKTRSLDMWWLTWQCDLNKLQIFQAEMLESEPKVYTNHIQVAWKPLH